MVNVECAEPGLRRASVKQALAFFCEDSAINGWEVWYIGQAETGNHDKGRK